MELITHLGALVIGMLLGFWGRKYWGKRNAASLAAADEAAGKLGDRWGK